MKTAKRTDAQTLPVNRTRHRGPMVFMFIRGRSVHLTPEDVARFHSKVTDIQGGHRIWHGQRANGSPVFSLAGSTTSARRVSLAIAGSLLSARDRVRTTCEETYCVARAHLAQCNPGPRRTTEQQAPVPRDAALLRQSMVPTPAINFFDRKQANPFWAAVGVWLHSTKRKSSAQPASSDGWGVIIRKWRDGRPYIQRERLARALGRTTSALYKWERGNTRPSRADIEVMESIKPGLIRLLFPDEAESTSPAPAIVAAPALGPLTAFTSKQLARLDDGRCPQCGKLLSSTPSTVEAGHVQLHCEHHGGFAMIVHADSFWASRLAT